MRGKQAFKNVITNILLQVTLAVSGLLLPQWYLLTYGSAMNGMVTSLTQFMAYLALVEAGIGAAAIVGLYGPLADKNTSDINGVLSATRKFYYESGIFYVVLVVLLTLFYPLLISGEISASEIRGIAIVLSVSNVIDFFYIGKYKVLLTADQKGYVITFAQIFGTILNTIVAIVLMHFKFSIFTVKFVSMLVYTLRSIYIYYYIKKHYRYLNFKVEPKESALGERWAALIHQIAGIVLNNTNFIILTLFFREKALILISVYSIYQMVANLVANIIGAFTGSMTACFGELIYLGDKDILRKAYSNYEYVFFIILFLAYSCMGILFMPFIKLYTAGITDANYIKISFVVLFTLIGLLTNMRNPAITIIMAAGHYKKTQRRAITEAIINIVIAVALVRRLQADGVLLGTVVALVYSFFSVIIYCNRNLINGILGVTAKRIFRNAVIMIVVFYFYQKFICININGYVAWFLQALVIGVGVMMLFLFVNAFAEPKQFKDCLERMRMMFLLRKGE